MNLSETGHMRKYWNASTCSPGCMSTMVQGFVRAEVPTVGVWSGMVQHGRGVHWSCLRWVPTGLRAKAQIGGRLRCVLKHKGVGPGGGLRAEAPRLVWVVGGLLLAMSLCSPGVDGRIIGLFCCVCVLCCAGSHSTPACWSGLLPQHNIFSVLGKPCC